MDFTGALKDKQILKLLPKGQIIQVSALVDKYNSVNKCQKRIILTTNMAVYNFAPKSIFSWIRGRLRRRIPFTTVSGMTVSRHGTQFVIHISGQHDYRLSSRNHKLHLVQAICKGFCTAFSAQMPCYYKDDLALTQFTTTTTDLRKGIKRIPKDKPILLNPDNILSTQESKGSSKLVFAKKGLKDMHLQSFTLVKTLGRGAFGKVMLCIKQDTGQYFAVKSLRKQKLISTESVQKAMTERHILQSLNHPFIMSLLYAFQTKQKVFFVLRFIPGGQLYFHLKKLNKFTELQSKFYAAQIVLAIAYIHQQGYVYRDIKPQNILLDKNGYILLTDFGLAKPLRRDQRTHTTVGTAEYMPPQIIKRQGHGYGADWWSLGILIYQMTLGKTPFFNISDKKVYQNICKNSVLYPQGCKLSTSCKDIINRLLNKNQDQRLGSRGSIQILEHQWFKNIDWQKLLAYKLPVQYKPDIGKTQGDVINFDTHVTREQAINSVVKNPDLILLKKFESKFQGMNLMQ